MIYHGDGLEMLAELDDGSTQLIWTDPPFGTDSFQRIVSTGLAYRDSTVDTTVQQMEELAHQSARVLSEDGVLAVCLDYRAIHESCSVISQILDFRGEVIWSFGLGRPSTTWWSNKHNTIALFCRRGSTPRFHYDRVPTTIRKAPKDGYANTKKVASVWDLTMSNTDPERVGYPNQKPLAIIEPFVLVHTDVDDLVVDPFAGSGSTAVAAHKNSRKFAVADINPKAIEVINQRLLTD